MSAIDDRGELTVVMTWIPRQSTKTQVHTNRPGQFTPESTSYEVRRPRCIFGLSDAHATRGRSAGTRLNNHDRSKHKDNEALLPG